MDPPAQDVAALLATLGRLWDAERDEERARDRASLHGVPLAAQEADGRLCRHLGVAEESMGPGGLWALTLQRPDGLPITRLDAGPGDPLGLGGPETLASATRAGEVHAVLQRADATSLTVLLDDRAVDNLPDGKLAVWPLGSPVTHERGRAALSRAADATKGRPAQLRDILLGARPARPPEPSGNAVTGLNEAQQHAVTQALGAPDLFLIHGPPGTGKTTTAAALAQAAVERGERVLLCAASNTGADQLARAVIRRGPQVLRVGHPARVDEALHPSLLSSRVAAHPRMKVARDLIRQAENLRNRSGDSRKGAFAARAERAQRRNEWRAMIKDARLYAQQAEEEVLRNARVVACTLTVLGGPQLAGEVFDLCILDEASQAVTPLALIPLPVVERVVLVGDHKQLPPTVVSEKAARGGLSTTLFDRLHASGAPSAMLTVQHRMHQDLMAFPNMRHYGGQLTAHSTVATRSLANALGHPVTDAELQAPFTFIDTAGTGFSEEQPEGSLSQRNPGEARLCAALVRQVMAQGVPASDVGLVVPYRAQVSLLTEMMAAEIKAGLEVDSVDSFQGREKEVVVLGLTRSNENGEMGFVNDARRLNVALTRARTLLRVVGDAATVGVSGEGRALLDHAARTGSHVSAWGLSIFEAPNT